jgi:hypothetical protein
MIQYDQPHVSILFIPRIKNPKDAMSPKQRVGGASVNASKSVGSVNSMGHLTLVSHLSSFVSLISPQPQRSLAILYLYV